MTFGGYLISAMVLLILLALLESVAPYSVMPLALVLWLGSALIYDRTTGGKLTSELNTIAGMIGA